MGSKRRKREWKYRSWEMGWKETCWEKLIGGGIFYIREICYWLYEER